MTNQDSRQPATRSAGVVPAVRPPDGPALREAPTARAHDAVTRASGVAAILGGSLAIIAAVVLALMPPGCVADECAIRPMRIIPPGIGAIGAAAAVLTVIGLAGLARLAAGRGTGVRLGRAAVVCGVAGVTVLLGALLGQELLFDGDLSSMPVFVGIGGLLVLTGLALLVTLLFRTRALPLWLTIAFSASCALLIALNDQNAAILFVVPFNLTLVAIGLVMTRRLD